MKMKGRGGEGEKRRRGEMVRGRKKEIVVRFPSWEG